MFVRENDNLMTRVCVVAFTNPGRLEMNARYLLGVFEF